MAGLTSNDFQSFSFSMGDLTRALRENTQALERGSAAGGPQGPVPSGAAPSLSSGQPQGGFWSPNSGAGSSSGAGPAVSMGLTATRQLLAAGGSGGAASLVGGLATGGLVGLALGMVSHEITQSEGIRDAGNSAFRNAPLSDTNEMRKTRSQFARNRAIIDEEEGSMTNKVMELALGERDINDRRRNRSRVALNQAEEDELAPQERALGRTMQQLGRFGRAGGFKTDQGRHFADEVYQFNLDREKDFQSSIQWARVRDARITSTSPGAQGALGAR